EFADAVRGVTTSLSLISDDRCSTCSGSGAAPGTGVRTCGVCGGRGVVDENQGPFSFSSPCRACGGRGSTIEKPCPTCSASGVEKRQRTVPVRIPPGVADGQTIRLKGKGTPGRNGGPAGDLLVEIAVQPHDRFGRKGDDLTVSVPVAFTDLVLGAEVAVPTLDGSTVRLRLRPGTPSGSRHRVAGRGVSRRRGGREVTGDLIATVNVVVPTELSDGERSAIEALAAATSVGGEGDVSSVPVDDAAPGGDEG
ncbi:MAG: molecular chaperone DnaJ, partial [Actinobacteria bacterium]|nr:molecular chaperone DnaJ [Actinomycetota bacterium]